VAALDLVEAVLGLFERPEEREQREQQQEHACERERRERGEGAQREREGELHRARSRLRTNARKFDSSTAARSTGPTSFTKTVRPSSAATAPSMRAPRVVSPPMPSKSPSIETRSAVEPRHGTRSSAASSSFVSGGAPIWSRQRSK